MYSSNLCLFESALQAGKMPNLQNLPAQICFAFTRMHFAPTSQFESEGKYLLPLTAFCD